MSVIFYVSFKPKKLPILIKKENDTKIPVKPKIVDTKTPVKPKIVDTKIPVKPKIVDTKIPHNKHKRVKRIFKRKSKNKVKYTKPLNIEYDFYEKINKDLKKSIIELIEAHYKHWIVFKKSIDITYSIYEYPHHYIKNKGYIIELTYGNSRIPLMWINENYEIYRSNNGIQIGNVYNKEYNFVRGLITVFNKKRSRR